MSRLLPGAVNGLWLLASLPAAFAFRRSLRRVRATQEAVLLGILRRNRDSAFGRRHGFGRLRSVADFRAAVPLADYEDFAAAVAAIGRGEPGVLTAETVRLLEPTSGSAAASKLVPYTASLQREFRRGIAPWIADLFLHVPSLLAGEAYWSVTPAVPREERSAGGLPIGFADDSDYLGGLGRWFAHAVQAVPPIVRKIDEMEAFWYASLLFLLRSRHLSLLSVWNPTYLTLLADRLAAGREKLTADLAAGRFAPPATVSPGVAAELARRLRPAPRRADEIRQAFAAGGSRGELHARIWPHLRLVSCWTDGYAARPAGEIAALFPQARLQGKGLIATEGIVSLPLLGQAGGCLALRSHFFEFLPVEGEAPLLAHELEAGGVYSVVLTTGGGFYRYRLRDQVEVVGRAGECPCLRFLGKEEAIADHFGEKLHEAHVRRTLETAAAGCGIAPHFALVACEERGAPAYTLFVEAAGVEAAALLQLGAQLDQALEENFHYRYCRQLGQLAPLRVFRIERDGRADFLAACLARDQRLGEVKPVALHRQPGWSRVFAGRFLGPAARECGEQGSTETGHPRGVKT